MVKLNSDEHEAFRHSAVAYHRRQHVRYNHNDVQNRTEKINGEGSFFADTLLPFWMFH